VLLRNQEIRSCFVFPPHLFSVSALPCETGNPEIASFNLNAVCCFANEHKTHLNYHLVAVELPFIHKVIDCMHQTIKTCCCLLPARSMFTKSVTVSVAV